MSKSPDHMAGINALPRWDPNAPTKYNYDSSNYDPQDYAKFKQARQAYGAEQIKTQAARSKQLMKEINNSIKDKFTEEKKKLSGGKNLTRADVNAAAKSGKTIYANVASECFESLSWRADKDDPTMGTAHAEFNKRNPDGGYDYDVDLDTFLEWCSDSLGEFFNAEIR